MGLAEFLIRGFWSNPYPYLKKRRILIRSEYQDLIRIHINLYLLFYGKKNYGWFSLGQTLILVVFLEPDPGQGLSQGSDQGFLKGMIRIRFVSRGLDPDPQPWLEVLTGRIKNSYSPQKFKFKFTIPKFNFNYWEDGSISKTDIVWTIFCNLENIAFVYISREKRQSGGLVQNIVSGSRGKDYNVYMSTEQSSLFRLTHWP